MFNKLEKDVKYIEKLGDVPNEDNNLTADQLKQKFDQGAQDVKEAFNNLVDEIALGTGASNVGAIPLSQGDTSSSNVQAKLEYLMSTLQNIALGQIPDGSVTKAKLDDEFSNTIAEKDGTIQTNLNSEKIGGLTLPELINHFVVTGAIEKTATVNLGFKPRAVFVSSGAFRLFSKSGYEYTMTGTYIVTTEKPTYTFRDDDLNISKTLLSITDNGFSFDAQNVTSDAVSLGTGYRYIAIR